MACPNSADKENSPKKPATKAKKGKGEKKSNPSCTEWTSADDATLINVLKDQQALGNQADNNWKAVVWTKAAKALARSEEKTNSTPKKPKGCSDHWTLLKSQCLLLQKMRTELSGWGWDNVRSMLVADDENWDLYIAKHPEAKIFRKKPFPLYDDILSLVEGRYVTGEGALYIPEIFANSSDNGDRDNNNNTDDDVETIDAISRDVRAGSDGIVSDNDIEDLMDKETKISTLTFKSPAKRDASSSSLEGVSASSKRMRLTGPVAVSKVANALEQVASAFLKSEELPVAAQAVIRDVSDTPIRRCRAIRYISTDKNLTKPQRAVAMTGDQKIVL
ncbi:hypothetical protein H0H81_005056 [Sphagnurus paluster]|uniref:Myb/SANT-like domain-containing protein n=1 Tax=Sphagnurus paluster TaxID=117069 RepID=A0A9P7KG70_9AGAR|nr:hypothetical protein H0H81_005056 [Sphagnurus paluster]